MEFLERKKCFCTECNGQLVARRTFYEHKRRTSLRDETCRNIKFISDPFDADISSDEDDMNPMSSSTVIHSDPEDGVPSLKHARLQEENDEVRCSIRGLVSFVFK